MRRAKLFVVSIIVLLLITGITYSEVSSTNIEMEKISLSKKLRRILSAEMNAVQHAICNLAIAIPAGKWNDITETANKISKTYILKKKLSSKELNDFYSKVPPGYKEIDDDFYLTAEQLSKSALDRNSEQVSLYFSKLNKTCVTCHSKYARQRFPGFKRQEH